MSKPRISLERVVAITPMLGEAVRRKSSWKNWWNQSLPFSQSYFTSSNSRIEIQTSGSTHSGKRWRPDQARSTDWKQEILTYLDPWYSLISFGRTLFTMCIDTHVWRFWPRKDWSSRRWFWREQRTNNLPDSKTQFHHDPGISGTLKILSSSSFLFSSIFLFQMKKSPHSLSVFPRGRTIKRLPFPVGQKIFEAFNRLSATLYWKRWVNP
jgi:hypothetical protein